MGLFTSRMGRMTGVVERMEEVFGFINGQHTTALTIELAFHSKDVEWEL